MNPLEKVNRQYLLLLVLFVHFSIPLFIELFVPFIY